MSTIHDALKKVQDDMGPTDQPQEQQPAPPRNPFNPAPPTPPEPQAPVAQEKEEPKEKNGKLPAIILSVIIVGCLGTASVYLANHLNLLSSLSKIKLPSFFSKAKTTRTARPVANSSRSGQRIQGIMHVNGKDVALINNNIYEVGDSVGGGKTIKSIAENEVILVDSAGKETTLKIAK